MPENYLIYFKRDNKDFHVLLGQTVVVVQLLSRVQLLQPHGLYPARLLCLWDSPGKNTGVGCHFLLQGIFSTPGIEPKSPAFQADSLLTELLGTISSWKQCKQFQYNQNAFQTFKQISTTLFEEHNLIFITCLIAIIFSKKSRRKT